MPDDDRAAARGLSLFPHHYEIVEQVARERRLHGNTFSPAVQFIIDDWLEQRAMLALLSREMQDELRRQVQVQRRA